MGQRRQSPALRPGRADRPGGQLGGSGWDVIAITSVGGRTSNGSTRLPSATQHPLRTAAMAMAALPQPKKGISGKRLAVSGLEEKRAKVNRRPDDWLGCPLSGLRSRPSGARHGSSGSGSGPRLIDSALCPRFSHPFISGGRWQALQKSVQPSIQSSTQSSTQPSVIDSALCHPSSIQPSTHCRWRVEVGT